MKRSSYSEHDYAFGQMILTLRTHIGLTQAGLAELLHVSRRAVALSKNGIPLSQVCLFFFTHLPTLFFTCSD